MLITYIHQNLEDISFVVSVLIQQTNYISYIHYNNRMSRECIIIFVVYCWFILLLILSFYFSPSIFFSLFVLRPGSAFYRGEWIFSRKVAPTRSYSTIFVPFDHICKLALYIRWRYEQLIISFELKSWLSIGLVGIAIQLNFWWVAPSYCSLNYPIQLCHRYN